MAPPIPSAGRGCLTIAVLVQGVALCGADFQVTAGFIPMTEASAAANPLTMTVDNAIAYCSSNPRCLGFCFRGAPGDPRALPMFFKTSVLVVPSPEWTTYRRVWGARRSTSSLSSAAPAPAPTARRRPSVHGSAPSAPRAPEQAMVPAPVLQMCMPPKVDVAFGCNGSSVAGANFSIVEPGVQSMLASGVVRANHGWSRSLCLLPPSCVIFACRSDTRAEEVRWAVSVAKPLESRELGSATFGKRICIDEYGRIQSGVGKVRD